MIEGVLFIGSTYGQGCCTIVGASLMLPTLYPVFPVKGRQHQDMDTLWWALSRVKFFQCGTSTAEPSMGFSLRNLQWDFHCGSFAAEPFTLELCSEASAVRVPH